MTEVPSAGSTAGSLNEPYETASPSFGQLILTRVKESGPKEAYRAPYGPDDTWKSFSWDQVYTEVSEAAAGLVSLGVNVEDRVAIASNTRLEWVFADFAIMLSGAATTTVYPSTQPEDVEFILSDSGTVLLIAENQGQADKVNHDNVPTLGRVVLIDGEGDGDQVLSWAQLREKGRALLADNANLIQERVDATGLDHLATLIYTSGTTGKPKGVELTHGNWTYEAAAISELGIFTPDDVQFLWLPLAHSFGKVLLGAHLQTASVIAIDGRIPKIITNLPVVQPTLMAAVPRIFEKVHAGVIRQATGEGGMKASIFEWAFKVGEKARAKEDAGESVGGLLGMQRGLADRLVFSKVRERMGGRLRYFVSGSAALSGDINRWFDVAGLPILEGYGLTETSAGSTVNRPENRKARTCGEPLPGTEIKIADDGEILIRGPGVMRGYRNRPDSNTEAFGDQPAGPNRWFASGDIGVIDDAGRIKITDRKKDLVKTSGGKYIAPGAIEAQFKALCPLAGAVVVIANERNFASALISLDPDAAKQWAESNGKDGADIATLAADPAVKADVQGAIDQLNAGLNKWETIKEFRLIPEELTVEGGHLTPSLKVKRKVVEQDFKPLVDEIYGGVKR
jgi:long-chain acyl-CoA synthetase